MLALDPANDPMAAQEPPREMSDAEVEVWRAQVIEAIREARPSVAVLRDALITDILPAARSDDRPGLCHMPDGELAYVGLLHASTSTHLTPQAIHQIGLQQLAALDDEYRRLGAITLGLDDPHEVRNRLRDDPSLRYATSDQIVADAMAALARAQAAAPAWFQPLPRQQCAALAVQAGSMAFYTGPSPDGARGGTFFFNTADPTAWTRFQLEATTFHESVPGHHLQLALANELDLHPLLGELEVTAYGEGWGLYAERLADQMSLYSSPLQRLGMVTLDSLRAVRLVVDTGIHAMGWTRDHAIEFFAQNTAQDRRNAEIEVDRYIAVPGQATSYMIGRMEIERLRDLAKASLGERFAIADFHRVVLGSGMTPLDELARTIERWIAPNPADVQPRITVTALDHIVLTCADVEATLAWYLHELGLQPVRVAEWRDGGAPFPSIRVSGDTIIDLIQGNEPSGRLDHLCLVVDILDLQELARSGRFDVVDGPVRRYGARGDGTSLYVRDPDGTVVELRHYG
jgi:uncharacterized protein (DUF885 family)/catechol 2,3-dioxygenase-like lactoylglutathione lyase family enzyme